MPDRILVVALALCIGACASSGPADPEATAQVAAASSSDPSTEVVCRREQIAGTRMTTKICRSRAEIDAEAEEGQEALRQMRYPATGSECALSGSC